MPCLLGDCLKGLFFYRRKPLHSNDLRRKNGGPKNHPKYLSCLNLRQFGNANGVPNEISKNFQILPKRLELIP